PRFVCYIMSVREDVTAQQLRKVFSERLGNRAGELVMTEAERLMAEGREQGLKQGMKKGEKKGRQGLEKGLEKSAVAGLGRWHRTHRHPASPAARSWTSKSQDDRVRPHGRKPPRNVKPQASKLREDGQSARAPAKKGLQPVRARRNKPRA
ncbi:MAG: hypothetical protein U1E22_02000, partial [Coriobacteriia bacterium]|nr:hypothetical protein [Coriobacteriia bacterium]